MSTAHDTAYAAQFRCPGCGGPSAIALGLRHRLICRCDVCRDEKGDARFWIADPPPRPEET